MKLSRLYVDFFNSERTGGLLLVLITIFSLILSNSAIGASYTGFWNTDMGGNIVSHWINDGLMTIFFLLIGLELEREIYIGELSKIRSALLPVFGAIGGMIVPALIYISFNLGTEAGSGAGIPMATDIAFAIGVLSLLGNRVPSTLKVFLTALAVIDDLGAIIIIAIFYTDSLIINNLLIALGIFLFLLVLNRLNVRSLIPYLLSGIIMWYFMLHSGVHATITGVMLAFAIPFGDGGERSLSSRLQHMLHKPVAFFILPLFALANTSVTLGTGWYSGLSQPASLGIIAGLIAGKPIGIFLFSFLAVGVGLSKLPDDLKWKNIFGACILGGIGFTMSIFITLLAFDDPVLINNSKIAILIASLIAGSGGLLWLKLSLK